MLVLHVQFTVYRKIQEKIWSQYHAKKANRMVSERVSVISPIFRAACSDSGILTNNTSKIIKS